MLIVLHTDHRHLQFAVPAIIRIDCYLGHVMIEYIPAYYGTQTKQTTRL